ncbi:MlaA family lipoprotein [Nitrococcus mobilis]|uniref:VacJ-like lipoprotein n=1 Tax=Nitrococcus mobilis Nb-231 TaxID=314278 RepID=A4BMV9_9GAMM|nr:VacJ family lipoprotein [Nitrococcus mobilis]EAR22558.1 VacJ-like lipoprotein [Nitrococcus mobilis Nb-231]
MSEPTTTRTKLWLGLTLLAILLAGCASNPAQQDVYDPLESMNRKTFQFNEQVDRYVLQPLAQGWMFITPSSVREAIGNFFVNMTYPGVVLNDILQGKTVDAGRNLLRFTLNSTLGIAGLFDPASGLGLHHHPEDFGQTLAVWGSGPGPYLILPVLGPSNFRDTAGLPADLYSNGLTFALSSVAIRAGLSTLQAVNTRAQLDKAVRISREAAVDHYAFIRSAYQQQRLNQIYDGTPPFEELYDEDLFEEDLPPDEPSAQEDTEGSSEPLPANGR